MAGNEHTEATLITKPTIAELEAILEEKDVRIEILPNGEVRVDSSDELNKLKTRLLELETRTAEAEHELRLAHAELDSTRLRLTNTEEQLADANKRAEDAQKNVKDLSEIVFSNRMARKSEEMCAECGEYPADVPGKLCAGCADYKEHTAL